MAVILALYYKQHYLVDRHLKLILNLVRLVWRCQGFCRLSSPPQFVDWLFHEIDTVLVGLEMSQGGAFEVSCGTKLEDRRIKFIWKLLDCRLPDRYTAYEVVSERILRRQFCLRCDTNVSFSFVDILADHYPFGSFESLPKLQTFRFLLIQFP